MTAKSAILGLVAETSLHAGTGQTLGAVDLPIQRETHTDWPCVYGSGVKGALRALASERNLPGVEVIFGPEASASEHAGALAISDARLALLPVRALDAPYRWVTSPAVLARLVRDCRRAGIPDCELDVPIAPPVTALVHRAAPRADPGAELFLEELRLKAQDEDLARAIDVLGRLIADKPLRSTLPHRLTIVDDVLFGDLVRSSAIPVTAHVALESKTKTVKQGALRFEESLPPDTVLYTLLCASPARKKGATETVEEILRRVLHDLFEKGRYLQIGGNETVGMGWCRVAPIPGGAS